MENTIEQEVHVARKGKASKGGKAFRGGKVRAKQTSKPLKGGSNIKTGGPGFIGRKGSSKTVMRGSRSGGKRV